MKLLLLKILLQRRARDEGFTLPMVIALGLVMLLLGAVNIVKSGEENVNSIAQSQRIDAFAVAELGAAQYRQLFDRNRALILQNRSEWTGTTDVCETISATTNGWASNEPAATAFNAANWRSITLNEVEIGRDLNDDGDATDTAINIGSYKIVDYEFDLDNSAGIDADSNGIPDDTNDDALFDQSNDDENDINGDGVSDARGILTVKGRTPDGSEAQIEYEIPVRINEGDLDNLAPALWINQSNITIAELGTLEIDGGNLVVSHRIADGNVTWDGATDATEPCRDPADITIGTNTISVESDPRGVPDFTNLENLLDSDEDGNGTPNGEENGTLPLTIDSTTPRLGGTGDEEFNDGVADNDPIFFYEANGLTIAGDLKTDGISDVVIYSNGNITINNPSAGGTLNIGLEPTILDYTSPNLQIHSTGNITINTNGGTVNITGLIHAPNGILDIDDNGTVNIVGAVWVNDFDATGATVKITPDQINTSSGFEDSYAYYRVADDRDPKPITQPPTNWKTEEAD